MKKRDIIHIAFTLLTLFTTGWALAQSKTYTQWKADMDSHRAGGFSFDRHQNKADHIIGPLMSVDISDKYWEAFGNVNAHIYAWMASGDTEYLDYILDVVQRDIENAVNMSTANPAPQLATYQGWNFNAFLAKPNYFGLETVNLSAYINNANPLTTGYGRRTASPNLTSPGVYIPLDEGMYNRNIAQLARVLHSNIDAIGTQLSNNGQTYQQRLNILIEHIRDHVWARNFENPNIDNAHYFRDVYRVNTHMSSHLAMVALCLYSIEGDQKYLDFVHQFLYDFDQVPEGYKRPGHLTPGQGFLDKLVYQSSQDSYWWVGPWASDIGQTVLQDEGHAVAELQFLKACYEEGIGLNPPDGEPVINLQFMQRMSNSIQNGYLKGYECADGQNEPSPAFRLDGTGFAYGVQSALAAYAEFNPNILCYLEARVSGIDLVKTGQLGAAMYTSRVLGVGGDTGPAFTPTGSGVAPSNNRPQVIPVKGNNLELVIGDVYIEEGANWTDVEDGTGFIAAPTNGISIPVDGSNQVTTAGTFVLEYAFTDSGSLTGTAITTVEISNGTSVKPDLQLQFNEVIIPLNGTFTLPTYSWTDAQDGGPFTTGAVVGGDTVDTSVAGDYSVTFTVTNSLGLSDTSILLVSVQETIPQTVTDLYWLSPSKFIMSLNSTDMPEFIVRPLGSFVVTTDDNTIIEVQELNENVFQLLAVGVGTANVTVSTTDGSNLSITKQVEVKTRKKIIPRILQN